MRRCFPTESAEAVVVELELSHCVATLPVNPIPSGSTYHHPITEHSFNSEFGVHSR